MVPLNRVKEHSPLENNAHSNKQLNIHIHIQIQNLHIFIYCLMQVCIHVYIGVYMCMYGFINICICTYTYLCFFTVQFIISFPYVYTQLQNVNYKEIFELEWIQSHINKISTLVEAQLKLYFLGTGQKYIFNSPNLCHAKSPNLQLSMNQSLQHAFCKYIRYSFCYGQLYQFSVSV